MDEFFIEHDINQPCVPVKPVFSDASFTCSFDPESFPGGLKMLRVKILGLPACPVNHKHFSRKTFKKALMAHRWSRNKAEYMCRLVANSNGVISYDRVAAWACPWIFL